MKYQPNNLQIKRKVSLRQIIIPIIVILCVCQVIFSNLLANTGIEYSSINQEINNLSEENASLSVKVASASSLLTIAEKSKELGLTKPVSPIYISSDLPVAVDIR